MAELPDYVVVNRARGKMVTRCASQVTVRDFAPIDSDEPPFRTTR